MRSTSKVSKYEEKYSVPSVFVLTLCWGRLAKEYTLNTQFWQICSHSVASALLFVVLGIYNFFWRTDRNHPSDSFFHVSIPFFMDALLPSTDYGHLVKKSPSLHCRKSTLPLPNFQVWLKHIFSATSAQIFRFL